MLNGQNATTFDPYLAALPSFALSMPIQVIMLGVNISLLCMLMVHLLFTIRYHLPLSKWNYALQINAVLSNLAQVSFEVHIVMRALRQKPRNWPYMFDYIQVEVPPDSWSTGSTAGAYFLQAYSLLSVHSAHIQFLTMLFPSRIERILIFTLLYPLALLSAFVPFGLLSKSPVISDLSDAISTTATSSLTLLYTLFLVVWSLSFARSRAWQTSGGTATFGGFALFLGVAGTAMNFMEIKEENVGWLFDLSTSTLLWQSWVGFWWWVGAGAWEAEGRELVEEREKAKREKELKRVAKRKTKLEVSAQEQQSKDGGGIRRRITRTHSERSGAPTTTNTPPAPNSVSSNLTSPSTTDPPHRGGYFSPIVAFFAPLLTHIGRQHAQAAVDNAAQQAAMLSDASLERRGRWAIGAQLREPQTRRRAATIEESREVVEIELEERGTGSQRTEEREDWRGRGMQGQSSSWWWKGPLARWRLKDVETF